MGIKLFPSSSQIRKLKEISIEIKLEEAGADLGHVILAQGVGFQRRYWTAIFTFILA